MKASTRSSVLLGLMLCGACMPAAEEDTLSGQHWHPPDDPTTTSTLTSSDVMTSNSTTTQSTSVEDTTTTTPPPCLVTSHPIVDPNASVDPLDISVHDLLAPLRYPQSSAGTWQTPRTEAPQVNFTPNALPTEVSIQLIGDPRNLVLLSRTVASSALHPLACRDSIELDATLRVRDTSGGFDEQIPAHLRAYTAGLVDFRAELAWESIGGTLELGQLEPNVDVSPLTVRGTWFAGHLLGSAEASATLASDTANSDTNPLKTAAVEVAQWSADDAMCSEYPGVSLALSDSVGSLSGLDLIDRLRNANLLDMEHSPNDIRPVRLLLETLPERACMVLPDPEIDRPAFLGMLTALRLHDVTASESQLFLPSARVVGLPAPGDRESFEIWADYVAFSLPQESAAAFLARHELSRVILPAAVGYALKAHLYFDAFANLDGYVDVFALSGQPGCDPAIPETCSPQDAQLVQRIFLGTQN